MPSYDCFEDIARLLRVLGNSSTIRILYEASGGFKSGLEIARKLHLTPRKYYRCLRKLHELGVLECRVASNANGKEHIYILTPIGRYLYELIFEDLQLIIKGGDLPIVGVSANSRVGVINSYEVLAKAIIGLVEGAKTQILLATRYLDLSVAQSLMQAVLRGIELKSVTSEKINLPEVIKLISGFVRGTRSNLLEVLSLAAKTGNYRVGNVPTSFMVVDDEVVLWELPTEKFELAFISRNKALIEAFKKHFWSLWDTASKMPISL
ncbi:MAG: hypothetical protein QXX56_01270 [Candidatus Bathyarchaeia archaeon]